MQVCQWQHYSPHLHTHTHSNSIQGSVQREMYAKIDINLLLKGASKIILTVTVHIHKTLPTFSCPRETSVSFTVPQWRDYGWLPSMVQNLEKRFILDVCSLMTIQTRRHLMRTRKFQNLDLQVSICIWVIISATTLNTTANSKVWQNLGGAQHSEGINALGTLEHGRTHE